MILKRMTGGLIGIIVAATGYVIPAGAGEPALFPWPWQADLKVAPDRPDDALGAMLTIWSDDTAMPDPAPTTAAAPRAAALTVPGIAGAGFTGSGGYAVRAARLTALTSGIGPETPAGWPPAATGDALAEAMADRSLRPAILGPHDPVELQAVDLAGAAGIGGKDWVVQNQGTDAW